VTKNVENCENCAFGQDEYRQFNYRCRRHAPIAILSEFGVQKGWPPVSRIDFCGDFELKDAQ
jgi:hypothetical protein